MKKTLSALFIFLILALNGCSNTHFGSTYTNDIASTADLTSTPVPSVTRTIKPTLTPRLTYTASATAFPTLLPEEAKQKVQQLLSTNGGCEFPCWWGITPGKTKWQDARNLLLPMSSSVNKWPDQADDKVRYSFTLPIEESRYIPPNFTVTLTYDETTEIVEWISASQEFPMEDFIQEFGKPDAVLITVIPIYALPGYALVGLFFPDLGMEATLHIPVKPIQKSDGEYMVVCQEDLRTSGFIAGITLWSSAEIHLENAMQIVNTEKSMLFEETTNMTIEELYDLMLGNSIGKCLETPRNIWSED